jgi:hypothetical protein
MINSSMAGLEKWIGFENIFENSMNFKNLSSIVSIISLQLDDKAARNMLKIIERKYKYPKGKCLDIKIGIDPEFNKDKAVSLLIGFKQKSGIEVILKMTDPNREYFMSDSFSFSGKEIKKRLDPKHITKMDIYKVQLHEFDNLGEDKEANCRNYEKDTNKSFKTFEIEIWLHAALVY